MIDFKTDSSVYRHMKKIFVMSAMKMVQNT